MRQLSVPATVAVKLLETLSAVSETTSRTVSLRFGVSGPAGLSTMRMSPTCTPSVTNVAPAEAKLFWLFVDEPSLPDARITRRSSNTTWIDAGSTHAPGRMAGGAASTIAGVFAVGGA